MSLQDYVTLGRSGLRVSPLSLGTMTFGTEWGWGSEEAQARQIFDRYLDQGGNFVDTANLYTGGKSEQMVGKFISEKKLRDRIVLATKFTFNTEQGNPNTGGNGRKNIYQALEASLRRLQTDYIDLYWLHAWDLVTPAEEVVSTLNDLVGHGKIRYYGFSDTPAWYVARAQTLAEKKARNGSSRCSWSIPLLSAISSESTFPSRKNWESACVLGVLWPEDFSPENTSAKVSRAEAKAGSRQPRDPAIRRSTSSASATGGFTTY